MEIMGHVKVSGKLHKMVCTRTFEYEWRTAWKYWQGQGHRTCPQQAKPLLISQCAECLARLEHRRRHS